ncbi:MAG: DUF167 family protein [Nanoarchaeota archaeon]
MIIHVKVKLSASEDKIEKLIDGSYLIYITERVEDWKANIAVVKMLAKEFEVSFKNIRIKNPISGKKIVEIDTVA